jgi:signal transduction histidine kinase
MDLVERKNKSLGEVAVLTAHELRKSVANILGLGELMERSGDKEKILDEILPMVIHSSREMDKNLRVLVDNVHQAQVEENPIQPHGIGDRRL